uniref:Uncharacterized protein n=1 Tax=Avena sativa TaxID=4498 RepID=A0ACD5VD38_AVESA
MAASAAAHKAASSWASRLHPDLIPQIGWRVLAGGDLLDYVRFRAVCALWRSTTISPRGRGLVDPRFHPRSWLLLPEGHDICPGHSSLLGYVRFFNLSTGFFVRASLPIFQNHYILDIVDGLILLLEEQDSTVRLLNPFTGDTADLPPLAAPTNLSLGSRYLMCFREISATTVTVSPDGLITVMILLPSEHHVAFATSGGSDREWSYSTWILSSIQSSVSFQSRIYILSTEYNNDPQIFEIDPPWPEEVGSAGTQTDGMPGSCKICIEAIKDNSIIHNCTICDKYMLL